MIHLSLIFWPSLGDKVRVYNFNKVIIADFLKSSSWIVTKWGIRILHESEQKKLSCVPKVERNDLSTALQIIVEKIQTASKARSLKHFIKFFLSYRQVVKTFWWLEEDIIKIKINKFRGFWISDRDLTMRACQIINIGNTKMIEGLYSNGNFLALKSCHSYFWWCKDEKIQNIDFFKFWWCRDFFATDVSPTDICLTWRLSEHDICPTYALVRPVICPT